MGIWEALDVAQVGVRVRPEDPMGDRVDRVDPTGDLVVEWGVPTPGEVPIQADSQRTDLRLPSYLISLIQAVFVNRKERPKCFGAIARPLEEGLRSSNC